MKNKENKVEEEEVIRKLKDIWDEDGECQSCGWHAVFYEVRDQLFDQILDCKGENCKKQGFCEINIPCYSDDYEDADLHRGSYLYIPMNLIKQLKEIILKNYLEK